MDGVSAQDVGVFEDLHLDNKRIASHADLNDKRQTAHGTAPTAPKQVTYREKMPQAGDAHDNVIAASGGASIVRVVCVGSLATDNTILLKIKRQLIGNQIV